jgi:hypothetical protein
VARTTTAWRGGPARGAAGIVAGWTSCPSPGLDRKRGAQPVATSRIPARDDDARIRHRTKALPQHDGSDKHRDDGAEGGRGPTTASGPRSTASVTGRSAPTSSQPDSCRGQDQRAPGEQARARVAGRRQDRHRQSPDLHGQRHDQRNVERPLLGVRQRRAHRRLLQEDDERTEGHCGKRREPDRRSTRARAQGEGNHQLPGRVAPGPARDVLRPLPPKPLRNRPPMRARRCRPRRLRPRAPHATPAGLRAGRRPAPAGPHRPRRPA